MLLRLTRHTLGGVFEYEQIESGCELQSIPLALGYLVLQANIN